MARREQGSNSGLPDVGYQTEGEEINKAFQAFGDQTEVGKGVHLVCKSAKGENKLRGERMRFLFKGYHWGQSLNRWEACPPPATIKPRAQFNRFRLSDPSKLP